MNVFLISPGRTATKTLAEAFSSIEGYTSGHETRVRLLGEERINYPANHFECDNRLTWFLPRLTLRYGHNSMLVNVIRNRDDIAASYNKRWTKILMMKAYSQGILMRGFSENTIEVCNDYVNNVYEHIEYFSKDWMHYVELDLECVEKGLLEIFDILNVSGIGVADYFKQNTLNKTPSPVVRKLSSVKYNLKCMAFDLFRAP